MKAETCELARSSSGRSAGACTCAPTAGWRGWRRTPPSCTSSRALMGEGRPGPARPLEEGGRGAWHRRLFGLLNVTTFSIPALDECAQIGITHGEQKVAPTQASPLELAPSGAVLGFGLGLGTVDHREPFRWTTTVLLPTPLTPAPPTAVQFDGPAHITALRVTLSQRPDWARRNEQRVPFQCSINVPLPYSPTAVQFEDAEQRLR